MVEMTVRAKASVSLPVILSEAACKAAQSKDLHAWAKAMHEISPRAHGVRLVEMTVRIKTSEAFRHSSS